MSYKMTYIRDLPRLYGIQIIYAFGSRTEEILLQGCGVQK